MKDCATKFAYTFQLTKGVNDLMDIAVYQNVKK